MPSPSVTDYLPRASHVQKEDELFGVHAQEYAPFSSSHSYLVAIDNKLLPEPTTNSQTRSHSTQILLPSMMNNSFSYFPWTGDRDEASTYNSSLQPMAQQYLYCSQDKFFSGPNPIGNESQDVQCPHSSTHDQVSPFSSMKCQREFSEQVNENVKARVGTSLRNSFPIRRDTSTAYFTEPVNQNSGSPGFCPRYRPLSSDLYKASSGMDTTYPTTDLFPNYPLAFERTLVDATGLEQYGPLSPDITYPPSPAMASPTDNDEDSDGGLSSEPYAQLIYRALKSVPDHRMVLKDIYEWFEKNTDKAKNNSSKGWQNSIRHNLSMNGAFTKVDLLPPSDDGKKGCIWVLEPSALEKGVQSTTRYRKVGANKKTGRNDPVVTQRQRSGARGGRAAKKTLRARRTNRYDAYQRDLTMEESIQDLYQSSSIYQDMQPTLDSDLCDLNAVPYFLDTPSTTKESSIADTHPYGFEDITGVTSSLDHKSLFYDSNEKLDMDEAMSGYSLCNSETHLLGCEFNSYA
ncbi:hypothetical protein MMC11_005280 [Xylographa trunciseda]|nr:hypothetical protein [Xylographa trunciseda]